MPQRNEPGGALAPYRVLDVTSERGWLCGRLLADMGADVIKVEPPGGDPGRRRGPFHGDVPDPERNLRWWFLNRGKRSVVLDLDDESGRNALLRLAERVDVVVESFHPGEMARRGLGAEELLARNPRLVVTSVTPFGQDGPYASYRGPDLVLSAMSGPMWLTGDPDRPPVRISVPQYALHGAAEAAVHTAIALFHAAETGQGQHVDVSAQLAGVRTLMNATAFPYLEHRELARLGGSNSASHAQFRSLFACADGHVSAMIQGGALGARLVGALFDWMRDEGSLPDWLGALDWAGLDFAELAAEAAAAAPGESTVDRVSDALADFFRRYTKSELYTQALRRGILLAPVNTVADIRVDDQLAAREYFRPVDQGELGTVAQAGPWARPSRTALQEPRRAPRVGEHTAEVLGELDRPAPSATPPRAPVRAASPDPFEGLKVWDMSWVGVGPITARYLADYGATVVRLDSTKRPDVLRLGPPFKDGVPGINNSHFYGDFNASKLGIGLDLENPLGRDVALRLVRWADVLLESFTPKTMAAWGMSYEELRQENPRLVMLSTCMQGQTGPRKDYRGFGNLMAAISGFYEITGWPDRGPTPVYGAYTDFICQRFTTSALVSAIDHQRRTGEGQHIDVSQLEAALQFLGTEMLDFEVNGRVMTRQGNRDADMAPHGVYRCRDGERAERWIAIAVEDDAQWQALVEAMGSPEWARDPQLFSLEGRKGREDELDKRLAAWTADQDADELFRRLQPAVAAGLVHDQTALHSDAQIVHRGYFVDLEHREQGVVPYDGMQARLSRTPGRLRKAAPCVGEDSYEVLQDLLGMSEDAIADLIAAEAVEIT